MVASQTNLAQSWIIHTRLVLWTSRYLFIGKKYKFFVFTNLILVHLQVSGPHWNVQNSLLSTLFYVGMDPGPRSVVPFLVWTYLSLNHSL